tara:strand:- start:54 stop:317 length:264 start_codon:yes stop_codon:yes gene_type:complete
LPRYDYYCSYCKEEHEVSHGYKEEYVTCKLCNKNGGLSKILRSPVKRYKSVTKNKSTSTGKLVHQAIEKTKEDIKAERKNLSKRYKK